MAYTFLTSDDIRVSLREIFMQELTDDDQLIAQKAEEQAVAKARSYLRGRYDVDALFAATGDDRNALLIEHVTVLFVWRLYWRINPRKISDHVKESYQETLDWLEGVATGKFNPDFPTAPPEETPTNDPLFGGSDPLKGHYF